MKTHEKCLCAADFRRLFSGWEMPFAVAGTVLCAALGSSVVWPVITGQTAVSPEPDLTLTVCLDALDNPVLLATLPILAALPFGAAAYDDMNTRYIRVCLPRSGRSAYAASKLLVTAASGALVPALGAAGTVLVIALLFPSAERPGGQVASDGWQYAEITAKILMLSLMGSIWSVLGGTLALATNSRIMSFAGPFLAYYLLVILVGRYLPQLTLLDPGYWMAPQETAAAGGAPDRWWVPAELIAIFSGIYFLAAESRADDA